MTDRNDENQAELDLGLDDQAKAIGLRKQTVWVPTPEAAAGERDKKKERQRRYRQRQAESGVTQLNVHAHESAHSIIKQIASQSADGQPLSDILKTLSGSPAERGAEGAQRPIIPPAPQAPPGQVPAEIPQHLARVDLVLKSGGWRAALVRWAARLKTE
jgi:hypothetical protein